MRRGHDHDHADEFKSGAYDLTAGEVRRERGGRGRRKREEEEG
jgi:hypothetical protein